jgi:acyl transferase domain-containing protein/thioesterase domain-containing protein
VSVTVPNDTALAAVAEATGAPHTAATAVAVIGMAGRFPGARNLDEFWVRLRDGVECISFFADEELMAAGVPAEVLRDPRYVKAAGVLEGADLFDAGLFGMSPAEAEILDPQQRLFLECAWEALEAAGYDSTNHRGRIGVFAGSRMSTYLAHVHSVPGLLRRVTPYQLLLANDKDHLATRTAYKLDLTGPCVTVQTACSTSLVAVHLAVQSLLGGESDMVLAGGVALSVPLKSGYHYHEGGILSPDGHCRAFDAAAAGTVVGSGVGVVVLKRLADAAADGDDVWAVVLGSAVNNDGAHKAGYTAPSIEGQAEVIAEALAMAGVEPSSIGYVEAHGTGTRLGDPIEIAALERAFTAGPPATRCAIGSVKANIGHADAAAGVAGLIKATLALRHRQIPPSPNFESPNPAIDLERGGFFVNRKALEWRPDRGPRRAGVSSFGIGGTNAHVVLEEAPPRPPSGPSRPLHVLTLSARTASALEAATAALAVHLEQNPDLDVADVAYTLHVGRRQLAHRRALFAADTRQARTALAAPERPPALTHAAEPRHRPVCFMFPGQGSQYPGMGAGLYRREKVFRDHVDLCAALFEPHIGYDLIDALYGTGGGGRCSDAQLARTLLCQPAVFTISLALAQLWMSWGVRPEAMIGHSLGEYVAASLAGVIAVEDAVAVVAARGRLMEQLPPGGMLSVVVGEDEAERLAEADGLSLAAVNGPAQCVLSGPMERVEALAQRLERDGVAHGRLRVSHAFHSDMLEPILSAFEKEVGSVTLHAPSIPFLSNVSGLWITSEEARDPSYWVRHLRKTVRFSSGLSVLRAEPDRVLIEVGPSRVLSGIAGRQRGPAPTVIASLPGAESAAADEESMAHAVGQVWLAQVSFDWAAYHEGERRHRVRLPAYPFERSRYWIGGEGTAAAVLPGTSPAAPVGPVAPASHSRPALAEAYEPPRTPSERTLAEIWGEVLGVGAVGIRDDFLALGGDSLIALQLVTRARESGVAIRAEDIFERRTIEAIAAVAVERERDASGSVRAGAPEDASGPAEARARSWDALFGHGDAISVLVPIQPAGNAPPLFCIHPAGGGVFCYYGLARHLQGERAVYGVRALARGDGSAPHDVRQLAARYVEAVRTVQPGGPYHLGGLSYGGNVAVEMALQLEAAGEEVALVALLDSHPAICYGPLPDEAAARDAFLAIVEVHLGAPYRDPALGKGERPDSEWADLARWLRRARLVPHEIAPGDLQHVFDLWLSHQASLRDYAPSGVLRGRLALLRAAEEQPSDIPRRLNVDVQPLRDAEEWRKVSRRPLEVEVVPGNHYTLLNEPHVATVARTLARLLARGGGLP